MRFTRQLVAGGEGADGEAIDGTRVLGTDPSTGLEVSLRHGPYGHYAQLGEADGETKPKRVSLPKRLDPATVDLDLACRLLALPRTVGRHPESGHQISAGIGRYGPYLKLDGAYRSLAGDDDVLSVGSTAPSRCWPNPRGSAVARPSCGRLGITPRPARRCA